MESLMAVVYLYNVNAVVSLTKMSHCRAESITTASDASTTVGEHIKAYNRHCWVSRSIHPNTNSHICPV